MFRGQYSDTTEILILIVIVIYCPTVTGSVGVPADGPDAEGDWEAARRDQFAGGEPGAEAREGTCVGGSSDPAGGSGADEDGNGLKLVIYSLTPLVPDPVSALRFQ